jgi:hypothetical protein
MTVLYADKRIEVTDEGLRIHGYYAPWGTKSVRYGDIHAVRRYPLSWLTGRGRIWGSSGLHSWANWDPARPRKHIGFSLDLGRFVRPLITPDDPEAVDLLLRSKLPAGSVINAAPDVSDLT